MIRHLLTAIVAAHAIVFASPSWVTAAAGPPFELAVKKDQTWGSSRGMLVVTEGSVEFRTADKDDSRVWSYDDIKQLQVLSPTRISILTYEDQGTLRLGADRAVHFELVGDSISADLVTFFLERTSRPIVTAVIPGVDGTPLFQVNVKHLRRGRGSEGTLELYDRQLIYRAGGITDSRYWRFADIYSVLRLDRFRLEVRVYEGGSGDLRTFVFEFKNDLPDNLYDALWNRVNRTAFDAATKGAGY